MNKTILKTGAPRTALMKLLDGLLERQVIYIHAPAGFGKTTSSLLWLEHRNKKAKIKHQWISLDEYNDKTVEFLRQLVTALSNLDRQNAALREIAGHPAFGTAPVEFTLRAVGAFSDTNEKCILVLDDLHVLKNDDILRFLPVLLRRVPQNCTLLLLSRAAPPDSFSEMAAKGIIAVVDASYLSFAVEEIRTFFSRNGKHISSSQASKIYASTGGWAIGVRAMLLSEEKSYNINLNGKYLENFLKANVWERWSHSLRRFMTRVSVVNELTPELCEWLTSDDRLLRQLPAGETLSGLARENAFLRMTGTNTYRFHDLFRDFLINMLNSEPDVKNQQLKKAGEWFYKRRDYLRSVDYFLKCGNVNGIAKGLKLMYDYSSIHPVIEDSLDLIRASLSGAVLDKYPFLIELQIWLAYMEGRPDDFEAAADSYYRRLPRIAIQNPASIQMSVMMRCLDYRGSIVGITNKLSKLPRLLFSQENTPPITQSLPLFHRSGRDFSEYAVDTDKNIKLLTKTLGAVVGDAVDMLELTLRAGLCYERGNMAEAHELALLAHVKMQGSFAPEFKFCAFMMLAHVLGAQGYKDGLNRTLENMADMIETDRAYFVSDNFRAYRCRLKLYESDIEAAGGWLSSHSLMSYESPSFYKIYQHFTTARAQIVLGDYNGALLLLKKLLLLSERYNRPLDIIEARVLLAIAYWKKGKSGNFAALEILEQAIVTAEQYGYTQIFANEGAELTNMLHRLQKRSIQNIHAKGISGEFVKTLYIAALAESKRSKGLTGGRMSAGLSFTDKQKTVMQLMLEGYTRNKIAEKMGLKPNSVKTHVELIYRKLDVSSNIEAVLKIKELGLLNDGDSREEKAS